MKDAVDTNTLRGKLGDCSTKRSAKSTLDDRLRLTRVRGPRAAINSLSTGRNVFTVKTERMQPNSKGILPERIEALGQDHAIVIGQSLCPMRYDRGVQLSQHVCAPMLYIVTVVAILLVMYTQGIHATDPNGLIAIGVLITMAITYRNQRLRNKK